MYGFGMLWLLLLGGVFLIPVLAISAFVRVGSVKKRLDLLQRELDILRLSPGSLSSEELLRRVARLEERLDHLRGVLRSGASSMKAPEDTVSSIPPAAIRVPDPLPPAPSLPPTVSPARPAVVPPEPLRMGAAVSLPLSAPHSPSRPPILEPEPSSTKSFAIDWDQFTGVKLFSWIGGFALFLGAVFFVKYSIDHGWVSPMLRVLSGFVLGTAAIVLGIHTQKRGYDVTGQTLAAAGCAILYADAFAAHALYDLLGGGAAFAFMALVTAVAFSLAVKMDSQYVALLGLVGGFLTPPLLSTGVDRAFGLFSYVTLLDIGLILVALRKRWMFLVSLAAVGTLCMQIGWAVKFFEASKMATAAGISLWFSVFFAGARLRAEETDQEDSHSLSVAGAMPLAAILCAFVSLNNSTVAAHPTIPFVLLILADAILAGLAYRREKLQPVHILGGAVAFFALLVWTGGSLSPSTLPHALAVYLLLGALHGAFAVVLHRQGGTRGLVALGQLYPVVFLIPLMMALTRSLASPVFIWPVVFLLNAITIAAAIATGFLWALVVALGFSLLAASLWLAQLSPGDLPGLLVVIGGVAALFFGAGLWLQRKKHRPISDETVPEPTAGSLPSGLTDAIPALGCLLPFLLLGQAAIHLKLANPAPVFGLGFLLVLLLLGLASRRGAGTGMLVPVSLLSMVLLQFVWHGALFDSNNPFIAAPWYLATLGLFITLPFFSKSFGALFESWTGAAAAGPFLFYMLYKVYSVFPGSSTIGALPAGLAVLYFAGLADVLRRDPETLPRRQTILAMFGGVALFFVSLIFPLQFDREWITLGWALEGLALVWLFRRVPHPGLKIWGGALLAIAFVRLALNPAVFAYHPRAGTPLLNWYLYAYGLTTACLFLSARLWRSDPNRPDAWAGVPVVTGLNALGAVLLFLLMNIQIADFFSPGATLTFNLTGSLAQDLSYTLAWGLFGLALLIQGLRKKSQGTQRASFVLLAVTIGKLFLHDVWRLPDLYKVAAFVGLAVVLIIASFLFQKFLRARTEVPS